MTRHGISTFYAELTRIKQIIEAAKEYTQMLFLIDEIFRGTNSNDRIIGATSVVKALDSLGTIGAITTHDMELCQLDKIYVYNLVNYNKVLSQRNQLLKDLYFKPELKQTLDVWDMQLAKYGGEIIKRREEFIKEISNILIPIHNELTDNQEDIEIIYEKNCETDDLYEKIVTNREKDIKYKNTSVGPHRDDVLFFNRGKNIRTYGSQGQKRTIALSLKLAEIELVKSLINDTPVLLLDDVLSELDSKRQNHLLKSLDNIQTIITCTGLDEFIENRFKINKVFQVTEGTVSEKMV